MKKNVVNEKQVNEKQVIDEKLLEKIEKLQNSINELEKRKIEKIEKTKNSIFSRTDFKIIEQVTSKNNCSLKFVNNEYNKLFIQKNSKNVMFVLFKKACVSVYTSYKIGNSTEFSTYNKKLCYRTNIVNITEKSIDFILKKSIQNTGNTISAQNSINELTNELNELKKLVTNNK